MSTTWIYALALSGFLTIALWYLLLGRKVSKMEIKLLATLVFITLGVLSLKYIDVLPLEYVAWFKYLTIAMCLIGGVVMLTPTSTQKKTDHPSNST